MYGERKVANRVLVGNLRGRDHLEDLGVDSKNIKIKRLKVGWRAWTCLVCLRIGTGEASSCECGDEASGSSITRGEFLD